MEEYKITSDLDFEKLLYDKYFSKRKGEWVFRGVSNVNFELIPSVARIQHTSKSFEKFERSIFDTFKRYAVQYLKTQSFNDYEWLAIAQHHGLPTRLMDWTFNPYVALYFACKEHFDSDSYVYALNASKKLPTSIINSHSPFELDKTYKFLAPYVTNRLHTQEGLFTISNNPLKSLEIELRKDWKIEKILVPKEKKERIIYKLFRLGIDESKLFPDLDGLSKHLKWQHGILPNFE